MICFGQTTAVDVFDWCATSQIIAIEADRIIHIGSDKKVSSRCILVTGVTTVGQMTRGDSCGGLGVLP